MVQPAQQTPGSPLDLVPHRIGEGDEEPIFVLPPQNATRARREYFERGNRILAAYAAIAAYASKGQDSIASAKRAGTLTSTTTIRLPLGKFAAQTTLRRLEQLFKGAGPELTRQFFCAVYGNFEAFFSDHVFAAFSVIAEPEPEQKTISLMTCSRCPGKISKIEQRFHLRLQARSLRAAYGNVELRIHGKRFTDPIEYVQAVAELRHRIVHSSGRIDQQMLADYPGAGLIAGQLVEFTLDLPVALWFFFIPLTEKLDQAFAERFGWSRSELRPESP